ncbi:hypothetical protein TMatcc_010426 [Talaromyces marneffei ATCC 18224]
MNNEFATTRYPAHFHSQYHHRNSNASRDRDSCKSTAEWMVKEIEQYYVLALSLRTPVTLICISTVIS